MAKRSVTHGNSTSRLLFLRVPTSQLGCVGKLWRSRGKGTRSHRLEGELCPTTLAPLLNIRPELGFPGKRKTN